MINYHLTVQILVPWSRESLCGLVRAISCCTVHSEPQFSVTMETSCYRGLGLADISDILEDYDKKMRDAETESHEGKRKVESLW